MTIAIGARCQDGVALIADRRMVRMGGLELTSPETKLIRIGDGVIAKIGVRPFYDALERALSRRRTVDCWDLSNSVDEIVARYAEFRNNIPVFPLSLHVNEWAVLYQITAGFPPAEMPYQVWGIAEEYGAIGRLFPWQDTPVDVAWKVLAIFVRAAAKASVVVGDGIDVALVKDKRGIQMVGNTDKVWAETERVIEQMVTLFKMRLEVPHATKLIDQILESYEIQGRGK